ncbi:HDOD domain-containing protein [Rhodoferax sp. BAB1]|uniref:HDOD domain-containing protein n=1 Tax=Rhodoferax sp. BAB1 TaxID=2741720 RepID=UPI0020C71FC5|nr:HDOD domain-containing protein [Rhodoferax sp. BAB1]
MMDIQSLLASPVALPSIPRVIALALTELNAAEPDALRVSSLLSMEPVMTARLLMAANSARFQLSRRVGTVSEALAILGLRPVRDMTIEAAMSSAFRKVGGVDMKQFWRYSLDTARLTQILTRARKVEVSPYTVGLVHALGELVMHRGMPKEMEQLNQRVDVFAPQRARAEHELLGYCYAQVGAGFARAWHLPEALVETLEHQDAPFEREGYEPMAGILHVASWRCRAHEMGYTERKLAVSFPDKTALALGLDVGVVLAHAPVDWASSQEARLFLD